MAPAPRRETTRPSSSRTAASPRSAPSSSVRAPSGAQVVDLTGHTVIPGIVGLHDHLYYTAAGGRSAQLTFSAPRLYLGSGVTTVRTTGSRAPYAEINLKAEVERKVARSVRASTSPRLTSLEETATRP